MTLIVELSYRKLKIVMIDMLKVLTEKVHNIQEQISSPKSDTICTTRFQLPIGAITPNPILLPLYLKIFRIVVLVET